MVAAKYLYTLAFGTKFFLVEQFSLVVVWENPSYLLLFPQLILIALCSYEVGVQGSGDWYQS